MLWKKWLTGTTSKKSNDPLQFVIERVKSDSSGKKGRNLCVFSHFDRDGIIDDYVVFHLMKIKQELDADVVFVSTSVSLSDAELQKVFPYTLECIVRQNRGRDLGSFKTVYDLYCDKLQDYEYLIYANDSVYGPLCSYAPLYDSLHQAEPTVFGITESCEIAHHLQSYFLIFNQPALQKAAFDNFWANFAFTENKWKLVRDCEISLSKRLSTAGCRLKALVSYEAASAMYAASNRESRTRVERVIRKSDRNPTHYFHEEIIRLGSPFLKVDCLRDNPGRAEDIRGFLENLKPSNDFDTLMITRHQARMNNPLV